MPGTLVSTPALPNLNQNCQTYPQAAVCWASRSPGHEIAMRSAPPVITSRRGLCVNQRWS